MTVSALALLFIGTTQTLALPEGLLSAICYVESHHNIKAIHKDDGNGNSVGVCQIKLQTARQMGFKGTEKQLMSPKVNVYYSGKYLKYQLSRRNTVQEVISSYNAGKPIKSNKRYVNSVLSAWLGDK